MEDWESNEESLNFELIHTRFWTEHHLFTPFAWSLTVKLKRNSEQQLYYSLSFDTVLKYPALNKLPHCLSIQPHSHFQDMNRIHLEYLP